MMFRFSLYGFLKNQQYYEPFLILAFREKGLSFFQIGLLIGFRELCVNLFEVPSGAVADLYGRRRSMIISFVAYIISFLIFAWSAVYWHFFLAMFLFACGEAFRTGTHKAMIFDWLAAQGRQDERTKTYGFTRSWSKLGSALSVVIASALVFWRGRYSDIFLLCIVPYIVNIFNFLGYPLETEGNHDRKGEKGRVGLHVWAALKDAWRRREQRRLILESMGFEGMFKVAKDYLQPTLKQAAAALALPALIGLADRERIAILVGAVYCVLHLLSSVASRQAHRIVAWRGSEDAASRAIWLAALGLYALLAPTLFLHLLPVAILAFICIHLIQNVWRPALVSRLNACSDPAKAATTLSIESQAKSLFAVIVAPALGLAVDHGGLWIVGALGAACAAVAVLSARRGELKDASAADTGHHPAP